MKTFCQLLEESGKKSFDYLKALDEVIKTTSIRNPFYKHLVEMRPYALEDIYENMVYDVLDGKMEEYEILSHIKLDNRITDDNKYIR